MAVFGALMTAAKFVMTPLPNVEPVSFTIFLLGAVFRWQALFAVMVFVILEALIYGFGLWWIAYLYVWAVALCLAVVFRKMESALGWAVLSGFFGLFFGALCALVYLPIGGVTLYLATVVAGIPFDLIHCAGNFAFMLALGEPCRRILRQLRQQSL